MSQPVRVALLGCGTVGTQVVRLMREQASDLAARIGAPLEIVGVAVRRLNRDRSAAGLDEDLFTTDALGLVKRDDVDVVVEVVGGIEPARTWLIEALRAGKSVVTANKALLAEDGGPIHDAALEGGADLYY
jgi:homoserine dehydrogenase